MIESHYFFLVKHKSSENIVIVVSNDEGIHNYCKKNLPAKKISVIWSHSLVEFIAINERIEEDSIKLHDLSSKMKRYLENYRREHKRRIIKDYPIEQLLLSLDLEKN